MNVLRALIIDPDDAVRRRLTDLLDDHGFDSVEATDGIAALQFESSGGIDLIVFDFRHPGVEGPPFLDIIRCGAFGPMPPPLIFCSPRLQEEAWIRKLADEGIPLLIRPFTSRAFELVLGAAFPVD